MEEQSTTTRGRIIEPWTGTGYPPGLFKSQAAIKDKTKAYICVRKDCSKVLREPMQLNCGHRLCKECLVVIKDLQADQQICDACKEEEFDEEAKQARIEKIAEVRAEKRRLAGEPMEVQAEVDSEMEQTENYYFVDVAEAVRDYAANKEILRLEVYCPYGCGEDQKKLISLRSLEKHMLECKDRLIPCDRCTETIKFSQLSEHMRTACPFRIVDCPNGCGKRGLTGKDLGKHQAECEKKPPMCQICRNSYTTDLYTHLSKRCRAPCPFGCTDTTKNTKIVEHLNDHRKVHFHSAKLMEMVQEVQEQLAHSGGQLGSGTGLPQAQILVIIDRLLQLENREVQASHKLTEKTSDLTKTQTPDLLEKAGLAEKNRREMVNMESSFKVLAGDVHMLSSYDEGYKGLKEKVAKRETEDSERLNKLETLSSARADEIDGQKTALCEFQMTSFNARLVWRLDNVQARRDQPQAIHSIPFFTEVYGYKMCAKMYFNGNGTGRGTHISLFFVVMQGDFDALLAWPFQHKVTMRLKNQLKKRQDVIEVFKPDASSNSFERPKNDMNTATGNPKFAEKKIVFSPENGFVVDDTMFIEIVVDNSYDSTHGLKGSVQESPASATGY